MCELCPRPASQCLHGEGPTSTQKHTSTRGYVRSRVSCRGPPSSTQLLIGTPLKESCIPPHAPLSVDLLLNISVGGHKHARKHTLTHKHTMTKAAEEALYLPYCVHTDQMSCLGIRGQRTQIVAAPEQQESPVLGSHCVAPVLVTQDLQRSCCSFTSWTNVNGIFPICWLILYFQWGGRESQGIVSGMV